MSISLFILFTGTINIDKSFPFSYTPLIIDLAPLFVDPYPLLVDWACLQILLLGKLVYTQKTQP